MSIEDTIRALEANRLMRSRLEVEAFEDSLSELAAFPTTETAQHLADVYLVFDDSCEQHEVMWGLVHMLERFSLEHEFSAMASVLPQLRQQAAEWVDTFMYRTLNSDEARSELRVLLPSLPADQQQEVRQVLEAIRNEDPEVSSQIDQVLK